MRHDVMRCQEIATLATAANACTTPAEATHDLPDTESDTEPILVAAVEPVAAPAATPAVAGATAAAVVPFTIEKLLQRPTRGCHQHIVVPLDITPSPPCNEHNTYRLYETQDVYEEFCQQIRLQYADEFWRMFATVYREKNVVIDKVLKGCRDVFATKDTRSRFAVGTFNEGINASSHAHMHACTHTRIIAYTHAHINASSHKYTIACTHTRINASSHHRIIARIHASSHKRINASSHELINACTHTRINSSSHKCIMT